MATIDDPWQCVRTCHGHQRRRCAVADAAERILGEVLRRLGVSTTLLREESRPLVDRLFAGEHPNYLGCDVLCSTCDTLSTALVMTRLVAGCPERARCVFGCAIAESGLLGVLLALLRLGL
ncbi:MAG: hypothetical protein IPJ62_14760 [Betaproteobacteria bacterium]|nr:hypothetical protein [Betaproteobacteria bacterium]